MELQGSSVKHRGDPVLALDIGGTWTRAALVSSDGSILDTAKQRSRTHNSGDEIVAACVSMLRALVPTDAPRPRGLGVSTTGPVDPATGVVFAPPNTGPGLAGLPLRAALVAALGLHVVVDRDTNAAALAELAYGAGRGAKHLVYVTVSTGVGGAVVLDRQIMRGANGVAGEIGHVVVVPDGPLCGCGRRGCLEAIASGPGLVTAAQRLLSTDRRSLLHLNSKPLEGVDVATAAAAGDDLAQRVLNDARDAMASAAVDLVNVFNPERLVLGGSVIAGNPSWVEAADAAVAHQALAPARTTARVIAAELGDVGGLLGAALLVDAQRLA